MKRLLLACLLVGIATASAHAQTEPPPTNDVGEPPPGDPDLPLPPEPVGAAPLTAPDDPLLAQDVALNESELALLGLTASQEAVDKSFRFWGFADFTSYHPLRTNATALALGRRHAFYVGNINLYVSRNLSETFRTLAEVRLTYLPNGSIRTDRTSLEVIETHVLDYADNSRVNRWGSIIMQRIYLEWTLHRFVTVRGGQFLTPFGIWNVDHGSPAYIPVQRPYIVNSSSAYFPERQTGLELFGRWDLGTVSTLGYHLTLSNGGGSVAEYRDFDKNKAVGARLYLEHLGSGYLRFGASGYYGRDTDAVPAPGLALDEVLVVENVRSQYDVLSLAGDLLYKNRGLHLQIEVATQQRRYTDEGRVATQVYFAPVPVGFPQNYLAWGGYLLAAYEISWFALTPYLLGQHSNEVLTNGFAGYLCDVWQLNAGFNVHPIDEVVFKIEYAHSWFVNGGPLLGRKIDYLQLQAAWAF